MSSGGQRMKINPRERAVSVDVNRLQAFQMRTDTELLRYLLDVVTDWGHGNAVEGVSNVTEDPMRGHVINGLRLRLVDGSTDLLITPGALVVVNPDLVPNPDDSPLKTVIDPGIQTGVLTLTPNPGGGIRIDVLECSLVDVVVETDNRDQFDPSTGLFTPVLLDKVIAKQLQYRIRLGVNGAGFPGTQPGWLPLNVLSVPNLTVNWDTVTVWDVRPLVSDRIAQPFNSTDAEGARYFRHRVEYDFTLGTQKQFGVQRIQGQGKAYFAGGPVDFAVNSIDISDTTIWEPGFAIIANAIFQLYYVQPFGLPRWIKYSPVGFGARGPFGPRGIPVVSSTTVTSGGTSSLLIALPLATGLGGSAGGVASFSSITPLLGGSLLTALAEGDFTTFLQGQPFPTIGGFAAGAFNNIAASWTLVSGVTHPSNAKKLRIRFSGAFNWAGPGPIAPGSGFNHIFSLSLAANVVWTTMRQPTAIEFQAATAFGSVLDVDILVVPGSTSTLVWRYDVNNSGSTAVAVSMQVMGWDTTE